jgi:hypothetical protein
MLTLRGTLKCQSIRFCGDFLRGRIHRELPVTDTGRPSVGVQIHRFQLTLVGRLTELQYIDPQ